MKGRFRKYSLICVDAPIESKDDEKDYFYDNLEKVYDEFPKFDMKICLGDFNAKVRKEEDAKPSICQNSLHADSNKNREHSVNFAVSQRMVIGGKIFQHKNIHKATWRSPDSNTSDQIDHVFIDSGHCSNRLDVCSYRGPNMDTDHFLVIVKRRCKTSNERKIKRNNCYKYDTKTLQDPGTVQKYKGKIKGGFRNLKSVRGMNSHGESVGK
jgi:hypothetical protein